LRQAGMKRTAGFVFLVFAAAAAAFGQTAPPSQSLDGRIQQFLDSQKGRWREENVTEGTGRLLYDTILKKGYTRALEIGTSTGHSGIWEAWALSKTGGSLITVEIEEFRHLAAVRNFKAAGVDGLIDARLGDARQIVAELQGPFDFIFIDADKNWTPYYFEALLPKLAVGGCFAVHNVSSLGYMKGIKDFLETVRGRDDIETTIEGAASGGVSLSFKKKNPA
ncbi:MAG TPA: class I SAM-dependent methyltransferase, partial [Candidatus Bathyarchaeia archaeon]|nr:class I SAM-dependent methyltransferase [Candidatus Bathyarchaeia archaeon]